MNRVREIEVKNLKELHGEQIESDWVRRHGELLLMCMHHQLLKFSISQNVIFGKRNNRLNYILHYPGMIKPQTHEPIELRHRTIGYCDLTFYELLM